MKRKLFSLLLAAMILPFMSMAQSDTVVYDNGVFYTNVGLQAGGQFYWGVSVPAVQMQNYTSLDAFMFYNDSTSYNGNYSVSIYAGDNTMPTGNALHTQNFTISQTGWLTFNLTSPVAVPNGSALWIVLTQDGSIQYPASASEGTTAYGSWISLDGSEWMNVGDAGLECTWMIRPIFSGTAPTTYTVTLNVNDNTMGSVTGEGTFFPGETCTITAVPNHGYYFTNWSDNNTDNPRTITVDSNITLTATFAEYPCTAQSLPYTFGFESVDALGFNCWRMACTLPDSVEPTAWEPYTNLPDFAHTGDGFITSWSGENIFGMFYMAVDHDNWLISPELTIPDGGANLSWWTMAYDARYPSDHYYVLVSDGSTDPADFQIIGEYTLTADDAAWKQNFLNISNTGNVRIAFRHVGSENGSAIFLDDFSVNAGTLESFQVTVTSDNTTMGTVSGSGTYYDGAIITISATPAPMHRFVRWNDNNTDNPRQVVVSGDITYTAYFEEIQCDPVNLPFTCGFEEEDNMDCWLNIDNDNDGFAWTPAVSTTHSTNSGDYCYVSASWEQNAGPLTPDNWLITPEIVIPEGGATITWYTAAQDANYPNEYYNVLVSYNASTDVNDFSTVLHTETISNDVWKWHSANIEGGHTVRIAFRHFNVSDMFQMKLDDVKIVAGLNGINEAEGANALVFVQDRSIEVRNAGNQPVFIYDATGRCLVNGTTDNESFAMPAAGVYMVKIGLNPAQKVVIAK